MTDEIEGGLNNVYLMMNNGIEFPLPLGWAEFFNNLERTYTDTHSIKNFSKPYCSNFGLFLQVY